MNIANELDSEFFDRALEETMDLLAGMAFTCRAGGYRQGAYSAVSVLATRAKDAQAYRIQVICHDPGHIGIDWDGVPLILIDRKSGDERISFLDGRGRAEFTVAIPADDELAFSPVPSTRLARVHIPQHMVSGDFAGVPEPGRHWNVTSVCPDGSLSAVAEVVGHGQFRISVQAHKEDIRNGLVQVILRSKVDPSDIWLAKRIPLDLNNGYSGHWSGQIGAGELKDRTTEAILLVFPYKRK